ncbi:MAG: YbjQ family protein [Rhizobiaceae bacterium]
MLIATTPGIPERDVIETLGLVQGSTIRAKHVGTDIVASLRSLVGGEVKGYTAMMAGSREQAIDRMVENARSMGADAVVSVRVTTSTVMAGAAEILCYGTAVRLK